MRIAVGGLLATQLSNVVKDFGDAAEFVLLPMEKTPSRWREMLEHKSVDACVVSLKFRSTGHQRAIELAVPKDRVIRVFGAATKVKEAIQAFLDSRPRQEKQKPPAPTPPKAELPATPEPPHEPEEPIDGLSAACLIHRYVRKKYKENRHFRFAVQDLGEVCPNHTLSNVGVSVQKLKSDGYIFETEVVVPSLHRAGFNVRTYCATEKILEDRDYARSRSGNGNGNGHAQAEEAPTGPLTKEQRVARLVNNIIDLLTDNKNATQEAMNKLWEARMSMEERLLVLIGEVEAVAKEGTDLSSVPIRKLHDAWVEREAEWKALHHTPAPATIPSWLKVAK